VVLFNRSFLSPEPPEHFVKIHGFISLEADGVAINPNQIPGRSRGELDFYRGRIASDGCS
jgi:hypothetical protein